MAPIRIGRTHPALNLFTRGFAESVITLKLSMKKILYPVILGLIISLAFFLRIYKVTSIPPALNWDEVSIGYNAYSILKTGRDEWGVAFPLNFKSYGEYKLPAQIYASIPAIAIFGLNGFGVRITPVIYGILTVLLLYLLVQEAFRKKEISLMSAFLLAVSPWHIQLTRASFESSFALFWIVMGIWLFLKGLKNPKWLTFSMIPFAISVYTYNSARAFVPLFLFSLVIIYWKYFWKVKKWFIAAGLLFTVLMLPLAQMVISGEAAARYKLVSITDEKGLIPRIDERRNNSKLPAIATKLIHNRYTPFILMGIYFLIKKKDPNLKILAPWLFLAFVPVAMTNDSIPNALRTLNATPVYQILTALGIYYSYKFIKSRKVFYLLIGLSALLFLLNLGVYLTNLFGYYPERYSKDWQYGNKEVVEYIKTNQDKYDLITYSRHYGEPHMFTLFYLNYDPARFQDSANLNRFETFDWVRVLQFDKYYFPDLGDTGTKYQDVVNINPGKKILFIGRPEDFPGELPRLKTIDFLNGERAFDIVESK
ncbi:MAG: Glycosyl transferase family 39 [Candidatus Woesebacteria bacterium GW2011_GWB1_40_12]|uniref:Glycosyl transferase family 39 n=1 Tax=Candidatus Woesebacteria bacterium GW2011_GWB1_40_12 TaxID=1618576 RepID=A0A0G0TS58_9BACT|nr:MAG: Glycosyl transferase family 39 [Candidatus Woesebacteria bacterium GW2011_GWB1_40_12]